jgi:hypothetical protein
MLPSISHTTVQQVSRTITLALAVLHTACDAGSGGAGVTRRDSAGVQIVENAPADSGGVSWWTLGSRPQLDVGAAEGAESEVLFGVNDAIRLSDGRLAIANSGHSQVRYYSPSGAHLMTVGRKGSGPEEFQRIAGLVSMAADSIAVIDGGARRVTVLAPDGRFSRVVLNAPGAGANVMGRRADGTWVAQSTAQLRGDAVTQGPVRSKLVFLTLSPEGGVVLDTLGHFPGTERVLRIAQSRGTITSIEVITPPFAKSTAVVMAGNDLVVGTQDAAEVHVYGSNGLLRRIIRTGTPQQRLTTEMIDEYLNRKLASLPPEQRPSARESQLDIIKAEVVPPYGAIAVDRSGNLWLQDYTWLTDDQRWTIFDPDGARIARLVLPQRFMPYDIGEDWILGRELDDLDVEHVRLYAIQRSAK